MRQYLDLLERIKEDGEWVDNRTGVRTKTLFGTQMRFSLEGGVVPVITTKKVHLKSVLAELDWMMSGSTNIKDLNATIWDEWRRPYTAWEGSRGVDVNWKPREFYGELAEVDGSLYVELEIDKWGDHALWPDWVAMMTSGRDIASDWFNFETFVEDVQKLPHYWYKANDKADFVLSPDYYASGVYSKDTCAWLRRDEHESCRDEQGGNVRLNLIQDGDLGPVYGKQWRNFGGVDQLAEVERQLKEDPDSRRIIMSAWNPTELKEMALPPCHLLVQFRVINGKLSCQMYQRSCDMFLGVPFNITFYAVLTHKLAEKCGLETGELIWVGGDCHIYENHFDAVGRQLKRQPMEQVAKYKDGEIVGYKSWGPIKAEVAV